MCIFKVTTLNTTTQLKILTIYQYLIYKILFLYTINSVVILQTEN